MSYARTDTFANKVDVPLIGTSDFCTGEATKPVESLSNCHRNMLQWMKMLVNLVSITYCYNIFSSSFLGTKYTIRVYMLPAV